MGVLDLILAEPSGRRAQMLPPGMDRLEMNWRSALSQLVVWRESNASRWPRKAVDPDEERLGRWLDNQRQAQRGSKGRWSDSRRGALDAMCPGWAEAVEDTWPQTLASLAGWRLVNPDRWPSKKATDSEEKRLGIWLGNQRQAQRGMGKSYWSVEREAELDNACPGWVTWAGNQKDKWAEMLARLVTWREGNRGLWPSGKAASQEERQIGMWLIAQRKAKRGTTRAAWSTEREDALNAACPGWETPPVRGKIDA